MTIGSRFSKLNASPNPIVILSIIPLINRWFSRSIVHRSFVFDFIVKPYFYNFCELFDALLLCFVIKWLKNAAPTQTRKLSSRSLTFQLFNSFWIINELIIFNIFHYKKRSIQPINLLDYYFSYSFSLKTTFNLFRKAIHEKLNF